MKSTVLVLGGGIIGVSCALELQARGVDVTLVDRRSPGLETSYGNAGVIARSSLMPMNNPGLWAALPKLMTNTTASLRYNVSFMMRNPGWALRFLSNARKGPFDETTAALDSLIALSEPRHRKMMKDAGIIDRLSDKGWIFLYRSQRAFGTSQLARDTFEKFDVKTEVLDSEGVRELEPDLNPVFNKGIWIKDSCSVNSPGAVVEDYAKLFVERGGKILKHELATMAKSEDGWTLSCLDGASLSADSIVVALGPWSRKFLERFGLKVPMGFERGYHMHFSGSTDTNSNSGLSRPIYDTGGGYVLSPMEQGLRLSTGVELNDCDAKKNLAQIIMAEASAREAIELGESLEEEPWMGSRPTMPDSRPVIGKLPEHDGLFFAFGHQHIGFSTGPGTAEVLADIMEGRPPPINPAPFQPERFIH